MSLESLLYDALKGFVLNPVGVNPTARVFPTIAPVNTPLPYITWQAVGGAAINFLDNSPPGKINARIQVNVWALTHGEAFAIAKQAEDALRAVAALQTNVEGAPIATSDENTIPIYHGSIQQFSMWF